MSNLPMTEHNRETNVGNGFSLIELIVSITIMSVGVLGYASSSVLLEQQVGRAALESDRNSAMVTAIERARSMDFDSLASGVDSVAGYRIDRTVMPQGPYVKEVQVVATGSSSSTLANRGSAVVQAADTFLYQVVRP